MKVPKGQKVPTNSPFDLQINLGAAVKAQRRLLGITQEELSWRADMHRTYLADIERGRRNLTLRSIANLALALQVTVESLLRHPPASDTALVGGDILGEILLVENDPDDAELTLRAFKQARLANPVKVVRGGREALDYLRCTGRYAKRQDVPPQLVLLALRLPDIPGLDVLREIRASRSLQNIPVVVLTVSRQDQDIIDCSKYGVKNYIIKPVDFASVSKIAPELNLHWALLKSRALGKAETI